MFLCLPDGAAREAVSLAAGGSARIIDCSTAHRTAEGWAYGFPELHGQREKIVNAKRVANPGCYATGFLSLVRPLVETGALDPEAYVACHALSGYTGAGKRPSPSTPAPSGSGNWIPPGTMPSPCPTSTSRR